MQAAPPSGLPPCYPCPPPPTAPPLPAPPPMKTAAGTSHRPSDGPTPSSMWSLRPATSAPHGAHADPATSFVWPSQQPSWLHDHTATSIFFDQSDCATPSPSQL
ncbi:uncharacterized protein LOC131038215 [Cryptomeria japonica]|uniref:uncharacterized protein LOC131038215 n=1 Tax=Cryptomeria japonica TaxID=3369 RepID=UPI0027D9FFB2|nr:uncharacterized protein LOC131038215 [Cryptomeria japonica]